MFMSLVTFFSIVGYSINLMANKFFKIPISALDTVVITIFTIGFWMIKVMLETAFMRLSDDTVFAIIASVMIGFGANKFLKLYDHWVINYATLDKT